MRSKKEIVKNKKKKNIVKRVREIFKSKDANEKKLRYLKTRN